MVSNIASVSQPQHFQCRMKRNLREDIFQLVQQAEFGLNVSQISAALALSRNTIKNHLAILEKEGRIRVQEFGRSKVILINSELETEATKKLKKMNLLQMFWNNLLLVLDGVNLSVEDGQEESFAKCLGRKMESYFNFSLGEILGKERIKLSSKNLIPFLKELIVQINQLINSMGFDISIELVPQFKKASRSIMIRVQNRELPQCEFMYQIFAGLLEAKMQNLLHPDLYMCFREMEQQNQSCYFEIIKKRGTE